MVFGGSTFNFFWGGVHSAVSNFFGGDFFFFLWLGGLGWEGKGKSVTSPRYRPACLSFFFFFGGGGDSAFALALVGGLTPFFFRG